MNALLLDRHLSLWFGEYEERATGEPAQFRRLVKMGEPGGTGPCSSISLRPEQPIVLDYPIIIPHDAAYEMGEKTRLWREEVKVLRPTHTELIAIRLDLAAEQPTEIEAIMLPAGSMMAMPCVTDDGGGRRVGLHLRAKLKEDLGAVMVIWEFFDEAGSRPTYNIRGLEFIPPPQAQS